ncbi:hypothetical protein NDI76_06965 [Halogeometricum sp. S1BR25-6]|uniref:Uncharacterized protein n=1 Tax=Halogeometricum salsisoli TaxID=2950536 RepID=A0ABU2GCF6_9EURY|nr:hypothetical protein [Halogeometricum sp. S1BR25-6]MDS0298477.1 hypothetical protein [Halogeometricum sp. S1BR25-6]
MTETPSPDSPPSNGRLPKRTRIALAAFCALVMLYSIVIAGQLLLGVLACGVVWTAVVGYRLVGAFFRFVDATERIADALESSERRGRNRSAGYDSPDGGRTVRGDDARARERSTDDRSTDRVRDS